MEFVDIRRACFPVYSVAMEISIFTRHSAQHESYCRLGRLPLELSPVIGSLTRAACLFQAGLDFERSAIFISSSVRTRETGEEKTTTTWFNVLSELEHKRGMKFIVLRIKTINMSLFDSNPHNSSFTGGKKEMFIRMTASPFTIIAYLSYSENEWRLKLSFCLDKENESHTGFEQQE